MDIGLNSKEYSYTRGNKTGKRSCRHTRRCVAGWAYTCPHNVFVVVWRSRLKIGTGVQGIMFYECEGRGIGGRIADEGDVLECARLLKRRTGMNRALNALLSPAVLLLVWTLDKSYDLLAPRPRERLLTASADRSASGRVSLRENLGVLHPRRIRYPGAVENMSRMNVFRQLEETQGSPEFKTSLKLVRSAIARLGGTPRSWRVRHDLDVHWSK